MFSKQGCRDVRHQQNVKTSPGPPRGVMVLLVLLVHPGPPWSTFSVKFQKVRIRMNQSGPGGPQEPQPPLVDLEHSGTPWTMLQHFPDGLPVKREGVRGEPPWDLPRGVLGPED